MATYTTTTGTTHEVLPAGAVIRYTHTAPFTYYKSVCESEIIGRNFYFEKFDSYTVGGGGVVYPDRILAVVTAG